MLLHEVFSLRLREARERLNLTQAEVAERIDIATEAYGRLERGLSLPRVETLVELSRVLRVPLTRLLGLEQETSAPDDGQSVTGCEGTPERRRVLRAFDLLTERGQRLVAQLVEALVRGEGIAAAGTTLAVDASSAATPGPPVDARSAAPRTNFRGMLRQWADGIREQEGDAGATPTHSAPVSPEASPAGSSADATRGPPSVLWLVDGPPGERGTSSRPARGADASSHRASVPAEAAFGKITALIWGARVHGGGRQVHIRHAPANTRVLLVVDGVPQVADAVDAKGRCELDVPADVPEDADIRVQLSRKRTRREVSPPFPGPEGP